MSILRCTSAHTRRTRTPSQMESRLSSKPQSPDLSLQLALNFLNVPSWEKRGKRKSEDDRMRKQKTCQTLEGQKKLKYKTKCRPIHSRQSIQSSPIKHPTLFRISPELPQAPVQAVALVLFSFLPYEILCKTGDNEQQQRAYLHLSIYTKLLLRELLTVQRWPVQLWHMVCCQCLCVEEKLVRQRERERARKRGRGAWRGWVNQCAVHSSVMKQWRKTIH